MEIKLVAEQLEAWARNDGWWPVTEKIGAQYVGDLLESLEVSDTDEWDRRRKNNALFIKRVFPRSWRQRFYLRLMQNGSV